MSAYFEISYIKTALKILQMFSCRVETAENKFPKGNYFFSRVCLPCCVIIKINLPDVVKYALRERQICKHERLDNMSY